MSSYFQTSSSFTQSLLALAKRAKEIRVQRRMTQAELAARCQLGLATVARFERSGNTSLENALRIAYALGAEEGFARLFEAPKYRSLDEVLAKQKTKNRQRVRKSS